MSSTLVKIKKVSRLFRYFFFILLFILPAIHILSWVKAPASITVFNEKSEIMFSAIPDGLQILHPLSASTKWHGFIIGSVPLLIVECILYFLIQLFRLYERATIFTLQNVNYLKKIGYALLLTQFATFICNAFLSVVLTWNNPHGARGLTLTISQTNIGFVLTAFIIILVSWIMAEGCQLREEQQLTI